MPANSIDLCFLSVRELNRAYAGGELSPVEVTEAVLARIEAENETWNALCLVDSEAARDAARASARRWRRGETLGPLDGIPCTVKDLVITRGWPTLRGSLTVDPQGPWLEDAPAVSALRQGGAVLLGKTNTPEFGSKGVTESLLRGITCNARDPQRAAGGSSGGAAVAAARGYGVLHIGTDGAGSVRIPAAFNGVFALKPTFGRVPAYPLSPLGTLSHLGPITRSVDDAATMLSAIARYDDRDWYALPDEHQCYESHLDTSLAGWRIAYSADLGYAEVDREVADICRAAAHRFEELGARVERIEGPLEEDPVWITDRIWFAAFLNITRGMDEATIARLDPMLQGMLDRARSLSTEQLLAAHSAREAVALKLCHVHRDYDLLLTPSMPLTAFRTGQFNPWGSDLPEDWIRWSSFSYPFNQSQQPAASCPCGVDSQGLPVGLQIVGPKYADLKVLQAAKAFEGLVSSGAVLIAPDRWPANPPGGWFQATGSARGRP